MLPQLTQGVMLWCLGLEGSVEAKKSISEFQFSQDKSFPEDCSCSVEFQGLAQERFSP